MKKGDTTTPDKERTLYSTIFRALAAKESQDGGVNSMTEAERDYCLIGHFDAEVRNGGFSQFFTNAYGSTCEHVIAALERIGASRHVELLREILSMVPPGVDWSDPGSMAEVLFDAPVIEATETLNDKYYAASQEFFRLMVNFATDHKDRFIHVDW